ncbi:hypothetical protein G6F46_013625 [Rhizopus delemar]|nr:hypothetical protein G6F46_013625 [Rhizopus delemar]
MPGGHHEVGALDLRRGHRQPLRTSQSLIGACQSASTAASTATMARQGEQARSGGVAPGGSHRYSAVPSMPTPSSGRMRRG